MQQIEAERRLSGKRGAFFSRYPGHSAYNGPMKIRIIRATRQLSTTVGKSAPTAQGLLRTAGFAMPATERHCSRRTEDAYWMWTRQFIPFQWQTAPAGDGRPGEIRAFLSHLGEAPMDHVCELHAGICEAVGPGNSRVTVLTRSHIYETSPRFSNHRSRLFARR